MKKTVICLCASTLLFLVSMVFASTWPSVIALTVVVVTGFLLSFSIIALVLDWVCDPVPDMREMNWQEVQPFVQHSLVAKVPNNVVSLDEFRKNKAA